MHLNHSALGCLMWLVGTAPVSGNLPFRLTPGKHVVGRNARAQIVIENATVSRRHAQLVLVDGQISIEDLGSSNGTFVNERPIQQSPLLLGDWVRFGGIVCAIASSPLRHHELNNEEPTRRGPQTKRAQQPLPELTATQQEIAQLMAMGRSEAEIAMVLHRSPHTIHTHVKAIFQRLGVHSRSELIIRVLGSE
jgi:DNA-binding CsgD family transcriptional regulator